MGQWHWCYLLVLIEELIGEGGHVGMHATLFVKHTDKLRPTSLSLLLQKSLKERTGCVAAILLLHDGWQLLVVAYHHEFSDSGHNVIMSAQQSYQMGLEYLGCLIDYCQRELLQTEQRNACIERCRRSYKYPAFMDDISELVKVLAILGSDT